MAFRSSILELSSWTVCSSLITYMVKNVQDVLQGTQLLGIDVAASMGLLKRLLIGDELTEKERKTLRRTMMDLASVVPIGVLMLLPVSPIIISPSSTVYHFSCFIFILSLIFKYHYFSLMLGLSLLLLFVVQSFLVN